MCLTVILKKIVSFPSVPAVKNYSIPPRCLRAYDCNLRSLFFTASSIFLLYFALCMTKQENKKYIQQEEREASESMQKVGLVVLKYAEGEPYVCPERRTRPKSTKSLFFHTYKAKVRK